MAYIKTDWVERKTMVSASKLNKIENQLQASALSNEFNEMLIKSTDAQLKELSENLQTITGTVESQIIKQAAEINRLQKINNEQNKEIAYLKLKQQASDRIEGGATFADDMNGNSFGINFDEKLSENAELKNGALTLNERITAENNIDKSTVVSGPTYLTSLNCGRKLMILDNGTLVCAIKTDSSFYLYKSNDNGENWNQLYYFGEKTNVRDVCIATNGLYIYAICCYNNSSVCFLHLTDDGQISCDTIIQSLQTGVDSCSLVVNPEGTELHACWVSKNKQYGILNIQYCKGVIGENEMVTWGNIEQVTALNRICQHSTIVLNSIGQVMIIYSLSGSAIIAAIKINSTWKEFTISNTDLNYQYDPSVIFVPKSVNGLENGRIWVSWHSRDPADTNKTNIRVSYSDNNGYTWSSREKLTSGNENNQKTTSITANKNNDIFITWFCEVGSNMEIKQIKWDGTWGDIEVVKSLNKQALYPSSLFDNRFKIPFTKPLFVYTVSNTSIDFTGSWETRIYNPTTEATAVYKLPSTDYVGMFVQKEGNMNIEATINDIPMDSSLENNEYQFTKALDNEEEVTLKLLLSRENTNNGNDDKITCILGGIS